MKDSPLIASIRRRLRAKAAQAGEIVDYTLSRYAVERLLYRLGISQHSEKFVLKGAMLFYLWNKALHRPTRDVDLLGFGPSDENAIAAFFTDIASISAPEDGLIFLPDSMTTERIREDGHYGGIRLKLQAMLGESRMRLQVDIGFGDAVTPGAELKEFPLLLDDLWPPCIRAYPVYTVVAEKLEALVSLGERNSRMKDFFDLRFIFCAETLEPDILGEAVRKTFERRRTPLPLELPYGLSEEFAGSNEVRWTAFLNKNGLATEPASFVQVVAEIKEALPFKWAKET